MMAISSGVELAEVGNSFLEESTILIIHSASGKTKPSSQLLMVPSFIFYLDIQIIPL